jgi:hypothetical protein
MINPEPKRPVTLEDLLRLKRAERPPTEFWSQFDRELRAKQLSALVEKRPWWRTVPRVFGGLSRYHLPLGATAILALTVVTVREYHSIPAPAASENLAGAEVRATASIAPARQVAAIAASAPVQDGFAAGSAENEAPAEVKAPAPAIAQIPAVNHLDQLLPALGVMPASEDDQPLTPTARFVAANLALAKALEPAVAQNLLGASHGFESRALPARTPVVEPLAQMASPSDVRRSRLLSATALSASLNSTAPARPIESHARRLSDDQLYDTISRFGARGNSVLVKF